MILILVPNLRVFFFFFEDYRTRDPAADKKRQESAARDNAVVCGGDSRTTQPEAFSAFETIHEPS